MGMRGMQFRAVGEPLTLVDVAEPKALLGQVKLKVEACAVCRTDLHILDGEVEVKDPPRILGHQIVGRDLNDQRFGVPWLGWTCGGCKYCRSGRENLCTIAKFTGLDIDGGFAEFAVADSRYAIPLPEVASAAELSPLLCAGLIGYRSLVKCGDAENLGIYGFGAAAHVISQVAESQGRRVFAFTRPGDTAGQKYARELGAVWAGGSDQAPPEELDAAIIFAPVGELVPEALRHIAPGGTVVCGGIHMSEIPAFPYELLWHERKIESVANLTRKDGEEFINFARSVLVKTNVTIYPLEDVNSALADLRAGAFHGSAVVVP
jgi:propanol-preferring alcohol dehydrogenase